MNLAGRNSPSKLGDTMRKESVIFQRIPRRTWKRPERRAPHAERAVHGASPFAYEAHPLLRELPELRTLKKHNRGAPTRPHTAPAGVHTRRDGGRCNTSTRARVSPETLSLDSVPCNGWLASNAPR